LTGVLIVVGILYKVILSKKMKLINCGDDCAIIGEYKVMKAVAPDLHERFRVFGMAVELSKVNRELEGIEFCQTHVLFDGESYRAVRNVLAVLTKDSVCIDNITTPHKLASWAKSVGQGGLASFGCIPVLQNFYRSLIVSHDNFVATSVLTNRQRKRMMRYEAKVIHSTAMWGKRLGYAFGPVRDLTRLSFEKAFGINAVNQLLLESYYDNIVLDFNARACRDVLATNLSLLLN
jgi:hypothetical protein